MTATHFEILEQGAIAFPDGEQFRQWKQLPSPATCLKYCAEEKGIPPIELADNTVNKLFTDLRNNPGSASIRSLKKLAAFIYQCNPSAFECVDEVSFPTFGPRVSRAALELLWWLYARSSDLCHPTSYIASVMTDLIAEDTRLLNNEATDANAHHRRLLDDKRIPDTLTDEQRKCLKTADTFFYLMAAQHAEFGASVSRGNYPRDFFVALYQPPYTQGMLQQRYFEFLRDLTDTRTFSALKLRPETRSAECESSSKSQVNAWKRPNGQSDLTRSSLKKLLDHSLDNTSRIKGDLNVYWEGYRVMLIMRSMLEELAQSVDVEQVNRILDRYGRYYEHHRGELASWDPSSPFVTP